MATRWTDLTGFVNLAKQLGVVSENYGQEMKDFIMNIGMITQVFKIIMATVWTLDIGSQLKRLLDVLVSCPDCLCRTVDPPWGESAPNDWSLHGGQQSFLNLRQLSFRAPCGKSGGLCCTCIA